MWLVPLVFAAVAVLLVAAVGSMNFKFEPFRPSNFIRWWYAPMARRSERVGPQSEHKGEGEEPVRNIVAKAALQHYSDYLTQPTPAQLERKAKRAETWKRGMDAIKKEFTTAEGGSLMERAASALRREFASGVEPGIPPPPYQQQ